MSDEEDSMSEGFSASEDDWKPSKGLKDGESSDDDDSDFEGPPLAGTASGGVGTTAGKKKGEPKARSAAKQTSSKKRSGLSLRAKLYNKYRPPPKTFSPPESVVGKNSPTSSTSRTNPKNPIEPNESKNIRRKTNDGEDFGSSSDSSIENYLVNPDDLDIQSSFFNIEAKQVNRNLDSPVPVFDCDAGLDNQSDSDTDEEIGTKKDNAFDFKNLLEYAKNMERVKESVAKQNSEDSKKNPLAKRNIDTLDVYAVLALGEKQQNRSHNDGEDEDDEDDEGLGKEQHSAKNKPTKLSKTKSTRAKRHTKTRPTSTVAANDTDDSDWEEVAGSIDGTTSDISNIGNLEIHVELPSRNREKKTKTQQDIEMAFRRRLNRDIKERQVLLHKASLLCNFGRIFFYNRLLNNTILMQKALKLLPSKSAYPPSKGTEIKYFQSMTTWFKSVIKLQTQNLYPEKSAAKTKSKAKIELLKQIENKEARSKQDMVFIFITLLRGMGLQCRLIVNMQPLPFKPVQSDLLTIKMKKDDKSKDKNSSASAKSSKTNNVPDSNNAIDAELKTSTSKVKVVKQKTEEYNKDVANSCKLQHNKKVKNDKSPITNKATSDNLNEITHNNKNTKQKRQNLRKAKLETKSDENITNLTKMEESECNKNASLKGLKTTKITLEKNDETIALKKKNNNKSEYTSAQSSNSTKNEATKIAVTKTKIDPRSNSNSEKKVLKLPSQHFDNDKTNSSEEPHSSQKENKALPSLGRLKRTKPKDNAKEEAHKNSAIKFGSVIVPKLVVHAGKVQDPNKQPTSSRVTRSSRSQSKSPQALISSAFLLQNTHYKEKFPDIIQHDTNVKKKNVHRKSPNNKIKIAADFLKNTQASYKRVLRSRQETNETQQDNSKAVGIQIPQLDGADGNGDDDGEMLKSKKCQRKGANLKRLKKVQRSKENSDEDFEPSPSKQPKTAPALAKRDRRVVSSDNETDIVNSIENAKRKQTAGDIWLEVWCDVEEQWVCVDIFKGKIHCVDIIRKAASPSLAYVFAFQNDLSIKDVTARYCPNWTTVVRKSRVDKAWLDMAISKYLGNRTTRDINEDDQLRRIHEEKPMPTAISDYKNHPFYVLERHLLKFEALYPPDAPALGYIRGESVYSRDCVHTLHSREIWLKQARTVKLGEKPYKIVKARPKWDRITQTVIKDQPLEIFGYWQTQDYEPPTAENGLVPRNAYGNVELFKPSMLPKKTKHIRLPGLNRICKKLGIDCANAVVGFDFHQGACHPTYDGFIVCEEFEDQVVAAWHQDQEDQERKEQEKYEARVYGNWKKLIRGLLIRERLKLKYNF